MRPLYVSPTGRGGVDFGIQNILRAVRRAGLARAELLRLAGYAYRDLEAQGVLFAVARVECRFRAPGRYDDVLTLTTRIERMTRARIDHSYVLRRGETRVLRRSARP